MPSHPLFFLFLFFFLDFSVSRFFLFLCFFRFLFLRHSYIPGCHHCQALVPTFTALGEALSGENDIVIAKMNMDVNDLPQDSKVTVKGYPTIYLYTARNKATPISYEGQRTVEAFLSFLKEHQTVAASIPSSGRDEL